MDALEQLLAGAAGYFGQQQQNTAAANLAKIQLQAAQAAQATAQANSAAAATAAGTLVPGVSNIALVGGGAAILGLVILLVAMRRK